MNVGETLFQRVNTGGQMQLRNCSLESCNIFMLFVFYGICVYSERKKLYIELCGIYI